MIGHLRLLSMIFSAGVVDGRYPDFLWVRRTTGSSTRGKIRTMRSPTDIAERDVGERHCQSAVMIVVFALCSKPKLQFGM